MNYEREILCLNSELIQKICNRKHFISFLLKKWSLFVQMIHTHKLAKYEIKDVFNLIS